MSSRFAVNQREFYFPGNMSKTSQPPRFSVIPTYRQLMLSKIQESSVVLSFDPVGFKLRKFRWCVPLSFSLCCHDMKKGPWRTANPSRPLGGVNIAESVTS